MRTGDLIVQLLAYWALAVAVAFSPNVAVTDVATSTNAFVAIMIQISIIPLALTWAYHDAEVLKIKRKHTGDAIARGLIMLLVAAGTEGLLANFKQIDLLNIIMLWMLQATVFTVVFNSRYNRIKGNAWWYLGETAFIDRVFHRVPWLYYVMVVIIHIISYIYVTYI